jgi:hypothetical protein
MKMRTRPRIRLGNGAEPTGVRSPLAIKTRRDHFCIAMGKRHSPRALGSRPLKKDEQSR